MSADNPGLPSLLRGRPLRAGAAIVLTLLLLGVGYLAMKQLNSQPAPVVEKLRVALAVLPQHGLMHIASAKGFFAEQGLEVTLMPVTHGKVAIDLVLNATADIAIAAEVPFVISVLNGAALSIAANMLDTADGHAVIARRDRGITSAGDLAGKKVGLSFGSSGEYFFWAFLIRQKLAPDAVTLVDLAPGQLAPALAKGSVDAVATWQPHALDAQTALGDAAVSFAPDDVYTQNTVLVARSEFLRQHRGAMEKLLRGLMKAESLTRTQPDVALAEVAAWLQRDVDAVRPVWRRLAFKVDLQQSLLTVLEDEARWGMERGYAPTGQAHNFLANLYLDALLAVNPERATVVR